MSGSVEVTAEDLARDLGADLAMALNWRDIGYDLPAYRVDPTMLVAWADGWPAAVRLARHYRDETIRLQAFKDWVHGWLDAAGVPTDPDPEKTASTGCRIGGRLEWLNAGRKKLLDAIRWHRDQRGDDRCWLDDEQLYMLLPEGYLPPLREVAVELANCERYLRLRRNPKTEYVSPQRRIEELEAEASSLREMLRRSEAAGASARLALGECLRWCPECGGEGTVEETVVGNFTGAVLVRCRKCLAGREALAPKED